MKIKFDETGRKLTEKKLVEFEKRVGGELPSGYRRFLLKSNGGTPESDLSFTFLEDGQSTSSVLSEFFTLDGDADFLTLNEQIEMFVKARRMPPWFLPIADDAFGNQICLSLGKDDYGSVYFWNHEREPESGPPFLNVFLIAKSFEEFVEGLAVMPED